MDLFRMTVEIGRNVTQVDYTAVSKKLSDCLLGVLEHDKIVKFEHSPCVLDIGEILESLSDLVEVRIILILMFLLHSKIPLYSYAKFSLQTFYARIFCI